MLLYIRTAVLIGIAFLALIVLPRNEVQAQLIPNLGGERAGVAGFTFLKTDLSPRAAAMGGAQISIAGDAYAANWNPAALCDLENISFAFANTFWVAGINHGYFSFVHPSQKYGTFALSAQALSTPAMERRTELQPNGTGEYFYATNASLALSYSKLLTTKFSYGGSFKYVNESLDGFVAQTVLLDLGFLYRVGFKDLSFAVSLMNFGLNTKLQGDRDLSPFNRDIRLESFPSPSVFSMGISMIPFKDETSKNQLLTVLQINHPSDNSANIRAGLEYGYRNLLFLRAGYKINVEHNPFPTMGLGIQTRMGRHPLRIDYGVEALRYLGWRQRIGLQFLFNTAKRESRETPNPSAE